MKKIGILAIAAMLFVGLMACEQKAGEGEGGEAANNTENTVNEGATTANTNPANTGEGTTVATPEENLPVTTVEFMEDSHNFGEIPEGEKVSHVFKFRNTGANPLKVSNVKPSCGCTTPDWTRDPIPPGEEGYVTIEFDSKGKSGAQRKSITLTANMEPANKILNFTGEVVSE
ncbi:MAG: DUF1573 domain-containing protein [Bacteroidota bacterium]